MTIWHVRHPEPGFTGYFGACDFYAGQGSTSSLHDAIKLLELGRGFKLTGLTAEEKGEVIQFRVQLRERHAQWLEDFKKLDAHERTPEGVQYLREKKEERDRVAIERKPRVHKFHR